MIALSEVTCPDFGDPLTASYWVVGDFASADDLWRQRPLAGINGSLFEKMLHDAGLLATEAFYTLAWPSRFDPIPGQACPFWTEKKKEALAAGLSPVAGWYASPQVLHYRDQLRTRIQTQRPKVVIALGDFALWCLTDQDSVTSWRGSLIPFSQDTVIIPVQHPRMIQKCWDWRTFAVRDLERVRDLLAYPDRYTPPPYNIKIRPEFLEAYHRIKTLQDQCTKGPVHISCDIETLARHISVIGIAWSAHDALVLPLVQEEARHYWSLDEEWALMDALRDLLTHPNCLVSGQNFAYDAQYFAKYLGYVPNLVYDTMLMQHTLFPGIPKDLGFLSSMYCHHHLYWKDELTDFNRVPDNLEQYWNYNGKDCCKTWEIAEVLHKVLIKEDMERQYSFILQMWARTLRCMLKGVRINQKARSEVAGQLMEAIAVREQAIHDIVGFPLNVGSSPQMQEFFYNDLKAPLQRNKKTKRPSCDDEALSKIAKHQPLLAPLINLISEKRSLGVFLSTFCLMPLDTDGRMRTSYNVGGTETFRFSSSENAFGSGGNLQNIPKGDEE
jgi:uracil-DNA glycosylase